ncbi:DUF6461 domain-containing protein [Streptomyces sp. NBC_00237]|uniref:DUF6461 domain-containing protein n=1 Tax=Streptomyces sp. NBC_00237 TaxID=2975687 RepID=UPI00225265DD|nr:DUF6461 domain-containing protein [Streptomyces sp. NBC_00237]MCX5205223.1 DUF6461 domain-containing protein [Streptomyces sp. NBC_00237]
MNFRTSRASPATAADYRWIRDPASAFARALAGGYTLTFVRGVTPAELADRQRDPSPTGVLGVPGEGGDWALALHLHDGRTGIRPHALEALSAGSRAVSHTTDTDLPTDHFHWYEDGRLRTAFEWPTDRSGSTPDALNDVLAEVGFDLTEVDDLVGGFTVDVDQKAAVFALTERLTGVRVTEELLTRLSPRRSPPET